MAHNHKPLPKILIISALLIGTAGAGYAYWWFKYKDQRSFADASWKNRAVIFKGKPLAEHLRNEISRHTQINKITVVNFVTPGCECNSYNYSHIKSLKRKYGDEVAFVTLVPEGTLSAVSQEQFKKQGLEVYENQSLDSTLIPASPAAAVFDANGESVYFGTYSDGALCGQGNNLVENRLDKLTSGKPVEEWINTRGYGCFCDW